jgi:hypothetical protein
LKSQSASGWPLQRNPSTPDGRRRRLCRTVCHYHPRHFRIEAANTVGADDKIGRSKTSLFINSAIARSIFGRSGSIKSKMNCDGSSSRRSRTRQLARRGRNLLHGRLLLVSGKSTDAAPRVNVVIQQTLWRLPFERRLYRHPGFRVLRLPWTDRHKRRRRSQIWVRWKADPHGQGWGQARASVTYRSESVREHHV